MKIIKTIFYFQSIYFIVTGVWPIISINTFMAVTGPKTDIWLVQMVGLLALAIGCGLLYSSITKKFHTSSTIIILMSCLFFFAIDVYYYMNGALIDTYLADAFLQVIFISNLFAAFYIQRSLKDQTQQ